MSTDRLRLSVNGSVHEVDVDPDEPLLWVLRDHLELTGIEFGCGEGVCGACSVLVDGQVYRSCVVPVGMLTDGHEVVTIEGLGTPGQLSPLQAAVVEHTAFGCGFCPPGMFVTGDASSEPRPPRWRWIARAAPSTWSARSVPSTSAPS